MCEHQVLQESELSYGIISCSRCLLSFQSADADADMCCCDHVDVIGSVADSESGNFIILELRSDKPDDLSFLFWTYSASQHHA